MISKLLLLLVLVSCVSKGCSLKKLSGSPSNFYNCKSKAIKVSMLETPALTNIKVVSEAKVGNVLLAKPFEYGHFLMKGSVLIVQDSPETGAKGLLLDKATVFGIGEMAPRLESTVFRYNKLFTGGEGGPNSIVMLHKHGHLEGATPVGSGLYLGGVDHAEELVSSGELPAEDFKFIFNYVAFLPGKLEEEVESERWDVLDIQDPDFLIWPHHNDNMWSILRNKIASQKLHSNR